MSLLWNWGSKSILRRCIPSTTSRAGYSTTSTLSASTTLSPKSSILPSPSSPTSLSSLHLYMPLRFKGGVKTNSGAKKRFRVRGSGSIKRYVVLFHPSIIIAALRERTRDINFISLRSFCLDLFTQQWNSSHCLVFYALTICASIYSCCCVSYNALCFAVERLERATTLAIWNDKELIVLAIPLESRAKRSSNGFESCWVSSMDDQILSINITNNLN